MHYENTFLPESSLSLSLSLSLLLIGSSQLLNAQSVKVPGGSAGIGNSNNGNVGIGVSTPTAKLDIATDEIVGALQLSTTVGGNGMSSNPPGVGISPYAIKVLHTSYDGITQTFATNTTFNLTATGALTLGNIASLNPSRFLNVPAGGLGIYNATGASITLTYGNTSSLSMAALNWNSTGQNGTNKNFRVTHINTAVLDITPTGNINTYSTGTENTNYAFSVNSGLGSILRVANGGSVYIGENLNGAYFEEYRLYVEKGIRAERVRVDIAANNGWADFVFEDDYTLMPGAELEAFIKKYKHLPNVPSAAQVQAEGIDLAEMNAILLRQIEELTLRVIALEKQITQ